MKFFEEHFTFHNFKCSPHKWFAALVVSPIHHAETRYKNNYHLRFSHAKKLFFFDILLMLSTVVLFTVMIFWWQYDPTITELVHLDIVASAETDRLRSGDDVRLSITYTNESDVTLTNVVLNAYLPAGFIINENSLPDANNILKIPLKNMRPGDTGTTFIQGQYYGSIGEHTSIQTTLVYTQDGKHTPESRVHRLLLTAREPSVHIDVTTPIQIVPGVSTPITLTVTNAQNHVLPPVNILSKSDLVEWTKGSTTAGVFSYNDGSLSIDALKPNESALLTGNIRISPDEYDQIVYWPFETSLTLNGRSLSEQITTFPIQISRPDVQITSSWSEPFVTLGDQAMLTLNLKNSGNVILEKPFVSYSGKIFYPEVASLAPNKTIPLTIPISVTIPNVEEGQDGPVFIPNVNFSATIPDVPGYSFAKNVIADPLLVGTTLFITQNSRYYTAEGDQLGRGPLPPQVGKETKYWIFTQIQNTVGSVQDITFFTTLAPGVAWTGKSSVSKGSDISFNAQTSTATWQTRSIAPYETVGIYFEVAIVPGTKSVGSIPKLITKSSVSAFNPYVNNSISTYSGAVDASLDSAAIGQQKGIVVE